MRLAYSIYILNSLLASSSAEEAERRAQRTVGQDQADSDSSAATDAWPSVLEIALGTPPPREDRAAIQRDDETSPDKTKAYDATGKSGSPRWGKTPDTAKTSAKARSPKMGLRTSAHTEKGGASSPRVAFDCDGTGPMKGRRWTTSDDRRPKRGVLHLQGWAAK